jgi:transposase-like protein
MSLGYLSASKCTVAFFFLVFGIVDRNSGTFHAEVVDDRTQETLLGILLERVQPDCTVMSDEFSSYDSLHEFYGHFTCNHSEGAEYVRNQDGILIHTNTIEGLWSRLKEQVRCDIC